ncbi:MAG: hypothetical protein PHH47_09715 [Gallionella sp.]|nr:hypothetical protein [Gallionella sp.]MDD4946662.1 hypothetical protein [Gallionella sp.]
MFSTYIPDSLPQIPSYHHELAIKKTATIETYTPILSPKMREIRAHFSNQPVIPHLVALRN